MNGWRTVLLGDVCDTASGGTPSRNEASYWCGDIPWITTSKIEYGVIVSADETISEEGLRYSSAKVFPPGTLLMAMYGQGKTRGRVAILGINAAINQACLAIMPKPLVDTGYLFNFLSHQYANIRKLAHGSNQDNLSAELIRSVRLPLPPIDEQQQIAAIFSAWDRGIEQMERLIAAKRRRKQALMQQLLTGKRRFKEFGRPAVKTGQIPDDWKTFRLKDVAEVIFSGVDKKTNPDEIPVSLCNYMDVYSNEYITQGMQFMVATASPLEVERFSLRHGDVMVTKDSETPDDIGIPAVVVDNLTNVVCGYHLALIRPDLVRVDPVFLSKQLSHDRIKNEFSRKANGAIRYGLTNSAVQDVIVWLPLIEEQRKIAGLLLSCDHEIDGLCKKLDVLKEQKKGLMQQLLTGRVRVPIGPGRVK